MAFQRNSIIFVFQLVINFLGCAVLSMGILLIHYAIIHPHCSLTNQMLDLSVVHILKPKSECHFKKLCLQEVEQGINARRQLANASTNTESLQTVIRAS